MVSPPRKAREVSSGMDTKKIIKGKRVLIVDDEEDILEFLT